MNRANYKMLVLARESRGLTQRELVNKIPNLNAGNYSKMEKGLLNVTDEMLNNIASHLKYPVSFFYKEAIKTPVSSFYYRKRATLNKTKLALLEAKFDIVRMCLDEFLDSVEIPEYNIPKFEITENCTASDVGRKLREFFGIPKGPINNLVNLLESHGVIVYFIKTDIDKFDGITLITDKGQPIIFINDNSPNDRKRLTIAHELIHLVSHIPFSPLDSHRDEEEEAFEGGSEFLMPFLECRNELQSLRYSTLSILKGYWGVSKAAIITKALNTDSILPEKAKNFRIELSRKGERRQEIGHVDIDEPRIIDLVVKTIEDTLAYEKQEILDLLSLELEDYTQYFQKSKYNLIIRPKNVVQWQVHLNKIPPRDGW